MRCTQCKVALTLLLYLCSFLSFANEAKIGPKKDLFLVHKIIIRGMKKVEPEAILEKVTIKKGSVVDNYQIRQDIARIFELKYFDDVQFLKETSKGKNTLIIQVKEKPVVSQIFFNGNDELDEDELLEQIKTKQFSILDVSTLKADMIALQKFYEEKGFYLASATYELKKDKYNSLSININIKEFDKVRVKKISFLGNKEIPDEELKAFMQTREEGLFSFMSGAGNYKDFNFQTDLERLNYFYKSKGFLQINISEPVITVSEDRKWIFITMKINEGPKFSVNNISFTGQLLFTEPELRKGLELKEGDIYSEELLRKDIQKLTEMYQDKGYAFANVLRTLKIVPGENKVDIRYSFEKGKLAYFGTISVKGNTKTRDKVVRRELVIKEGMLFSGSKLRMSKENVNRLGFFQPGSVIFNTVTRKDRDDVLDVEISIKERQTGQISVGAGYSTATRGFFQGSVTQNNFRGLGQILNFNLSLAENQTIYNFGFTEPYFLDTQWTAGGDYYQTRNSFSNSYSFKKHGFDLRVGYPIYEYTRLFFTYRHERTDISEARDPTVLEAIENGEATTFKTTLRYDRRNNIFEPTKGLFGQLSFEYAGVFGNQRWLKAESEVRYYKPVWNELVFRSRVNYSQLIKTTDRALPRSEKFTMGGSRNMRGFNFEDIGPLKELVPRGGTVEETFNVGGASSVLATVELEHPLVKEAGLKWVVFLDAGNVFLNGVGSEHGARNEQTGEFEEGFELRANYGFGFRWFSPIGVLRFEWGYPIDITEDEDGNQFHFDIGQIF